MESCYLALLTQNYADALKQNLVYNNL